nr:hypothetical protein [uncultured Blautia sp.]
MADKVKPDVLLKDFWRSNERFADLFNAVMFQGEEVLRPEELREMDTDVSGIIQLKDHAESLMRIRDVVKKMAFGVEFVVFGIESQQNIHYAMPLRTMLYDGMGYLKEYQDIKQELLMVIGKIIDSSELMHWKQEGKVENVCTAVKKWEKEWYENGRIEGRKTGIIDMVSAMQKHGIAHDLIIQMLCGQFEISEEEAKQYL